MSAIHMARVRLVEKLPNISLRVQTAEFNHQCPECGAPAGQPCLFGPETIEVEVFDAPSTALRGPKPTGEKQ